MDPLLGAAKDEKEGEGVTRISFRVSAVPVAQPRPRATIVAGHASVYEAAKEHAIHSFKASVRMAAREAYQGPPLGGPISLYLEFIFPRPQAKRWKTKPMPRYYHTSAPDVDNLVKGCADSLNKLIWHDDSQVVACTCIKLVASGDEQPHVLVGISQTIAGPSPEERT